MSSNLPFMALANVDGGGQPLGPILGVSPTSLRFNLDHHQPSPTQNISITNYGIPDVLNWQAEVTAGAPWLLLSQTSGTTPGTLGISVDTDAIAPEIYEGKIRITASGGSGVVLGSPQDMTVNVTVQDASLVIAPLVLARGRWSMATWLSGPT